MRRHAASRQSAGTITQRQKMQWSKNFTPRWALPGSKRTKTAIRSGIWMLRHIRHAIRTWKFCGEGRLSPSGGRKGWTKKARLFKVEPLWPCVGQHLPHGEEPDPSRNFKKNLHAILQMTIQ